MKNIILVCLLLLAHFSQAQDLFQGNLFPAEMIMKNREKIALTDQQAEKIKAIHAKNSWEFTTLKWDLDAENEKLKKMLKETNLNNTAIQQQMDNILQLENQLKKKQLANLLALRAQLKEDQVKELQNNKILRVEGYEFKPLEGSASKDDKKVRTSVFVQGLPSSENDSNGSNPLYIIKEGTKTKTINSAEFSNISPSEIQSVEVFKGGKALEYGEKGKDGVIIITLKKNQEIEF
jgi:hypothetical protein